MRAVIQRVKEASVTTAAGYHKRIGEGLLILLGISESDTADDVRWLSGKISRLRIFDDATGVMNLSVLDIRGEALVISQFTLYASTKKGNRPSWIKAAKPETAVPLYEAFIQDLSRETGKEVCSGVFGAMMDVHLINSGPVTIIIDTQNKE
jgi:D-aminoacyl-tRNA deacylase